MPKGQKKAPRKALVKSLKQPLKKPDTVTKSHVQEKNQERKPGRLPMREPKRETDKKPLPAQTKETAMAKATQKSTAPVNLGTKRACPKCATKFYDFNKPELNCPKCEAAIKVAELATMPKLPEPKKAPKKELPEEALMESDDLVVGEASSDFESLEDLEDDDDDVVEDIAADEDESED